MTKLKTWYFFIAEDEETDGPTAAEWVVTLNARCLMEKSPGFKADTHVAKQLEGDPTFKHLAVPKNASGLNVSSLGSDRSGAASPQASGSTASHRNVSE